MRRTKWLLYHNATIVRRIVNNGGFNIISSTTAIEFTASSNLPLLLGDVVKEGSHAVVLHRVLERTEHNAFFRTIANLHRPKVSDNSR